MSSSALIAGGKRPIVLGGGGMITKLLLLYPVIQRGGIANTRLLPLWTRPGLPLSPSRSLRTSSSILVSFCFALLSLSLPLSRILELAIS